MFFLPKVEEAYSEMKNGSEQLLHTMKKSASLTLIGFRSPTSRCSNWLIISLIAEYIFMMMIFFSSRNWHDDFYCIIVYGDFCLYLINYELILAYFHARSGCKTGCPNFLRRIWVVDPRIQSIKDLFIVLYFKDIHKHKGKVHRK